ncbi:HpsJ family protein [Microcystis aeruginosa]|uniref:HpsJ family protein n=1 Tax=Microcystis aeruginosa TaxID=1126 RepID=UPI00232E4ED7|nr:HpsJ family protein [Microcystis aeruginosa]MDB9418481.1 HpsJ family protein [Microcystis aeruginosa CS-556/03]
MNSFTSLSLKLTGFVFIISFLLDAFILPMPYRFNQSQWQVGFVTTFVDRGIVPLLGIVLVLLAYWIDSNNKDVIPRKSRFEFRWPLFIFSTLLGLVFLLMIPIHINNTNQIKNNALTQIEQGVDQGEGQIQAFLAQLNTLSQNPQLLEQQISQRNQVIESGSFQGQPISTEQLQSLRQQREQLTNLRDLSKKPKEFKQRLDEIKNQLQTQLQDRRKQAESQANLEALKQWLRIGIQSMLLSIGYSLIGWLGIRELSSVKKKRTAPSK